MNQDAEADSYVLDAEAFAALKRLVGKLRGEGALAGDERRTVANRMNALLQKAQPQGVGQERQKSGPECSNDSFWAQKDQLFGKM